MAETKASAIRQERIALAAFIRAVILPLVKVKERKRRSAIRRLGARKSGRKMEER